MNLGRHLCLFVCLFLWNLAIICVRANVLRVGHSSISQNNQGVGYRVCMCIEAAMCATLTPAVCYICATLCATLTPAGTGATQCKSNELRDTNSVEQNTSGAVCNTTIKSVKDRTSHQVDIGILLYLSNIDKSGATDVKIQIKSAPVYFLHPSKQHSLQEQTFGDSYISSRVTEV